MRHGSWHLFHLPRNCSRCRFASIIFISFLCCFYCQILLQFLYQPSYFGLVLQSLSCHQSALPHCIWANWPGLQSGCSIISLFSLIQSLFHYGADCLCQNQQQWYCILFSFYFHLLLSERIKQLSSLPSFSF